MFKILCSIGLSIVILSANCFSFAAENSGQGDSIMSGITTNIVGGYSEKHWQPNPKTDPSDYFALFAPSPSYSNALLMSLYYSTYFSNIQNNPTSIIEDMALYNLLTATDSKERKIVKQAFTEPAPIDSSGEMYKYNPENDVFEHVKGAASYQDTKQFSLQALINPLQFANKKEQEQAKTFIKIVSGSNYPLESINFSSLLGSSGDDKYSIVLRALQQPDVQKYLLGMRHYSSVLSTGINNLDYLYNERVPKDTSKIIESLAGNEEQNKKFYLEKLPQQLREKASPLAMDHWMATRRLFAQSEGNKKQANSWVNKISKATPATLMRENLILQAENRYELYKLRRVLNRILATMSVNVLQQGQQQRLTMQQVGRKACEAISKLDGVDGSSACPSAYATSQQT
jgi:hypothetical protein